MVFVLEPPRETDFLQITYSTPTGAVSLCSVLQCNVGVQYCDANLNNGNHKCHTSTKHEIISEQALAPKQTIYLHCRFKFLMIQFGYKRLF